MVVTPSVTTSKLENIISLINDVLNDFTSFKLNFSDPNWISYMAKDTRFSEYQLVSLAELYPHIDVRACNHVELRNAVKAFTSLVYILIRTNCDNKIYDHIVTQITQIYFYLHMCVRDSVNVNPSFNKRFGYLVENVLECVI